MYHAGFVADGNTPYLGVGVNESLQQIVDLAFVAIAADMGGAEIHGRNLDSRQMTFYGSTGLLYIQACQSDGTVEHPVIDITVRDGEYQSQYDDTGSHHQQADTEDGVFQNFQIMYRSHSPDKSVSFVILLIYFSLESWLGYSVVFPIVRAQFCLYIRGVHHLFVFGRNGHVVAVEVAEILVG